LVINIEPTSPGFGKPVPLDIGKLPAHPVTRAAPRSVFSTLEPFAGADDVMFRPGNRTVFYEDESNTLLLRPLVPLDEAAEHAVVVMTDLKGMNGDAARPPV